MNYELAKRLKDAGFPHNWCSEDDCSCLTNAVNSSCFPTLSELIEACGDGFWGLINDGLFKAFQKDIRVVNQMGFVGDTPEEAVANLWLELNKK